MRRYFGTLLLGAALVAPLAVTVKADDEHHDRDHRYYDRDRKDYHNWDSREDAAYRHYLEERHEHYRDFNRLGGRDQAAYWKWRHEHNEDHDRH